MYSYFSSSVKGVGLSRGDENISFDYKVWRKNILAIKIIYRYMLEIILYIRFAVLQRVLLIL